MKRLRLAVLMVLGVIAVAVLVPAAGARPAPGGAPVRAGFGFVIPSGMRLTGTTQRDRAMLRRSMVVTSRPASPGSGVQSEKSQAAAQANDTANPACTLAPGTGGEWLETCVYGFTGHFVDWTVPAGLTSPIVTVQIAGASGGDAFDGVEGGDGEYLRGDMTLAAGDAIRVEVGGQGGDGVSGLTPWQPGDPQTGGFGGYPEGGDAGRAGGPTPAGGGGGPSLIGVQRAGDLPGFTLFAAAGGGGGAGGQGADWSGTVDIAPGAGGNAAATGQPGADYATTEIDGSGASCTFFGGSPGEGAGPGTTGPGGAGGDTTCTSFGGGVSTGTYGHTGCTDDNFPCTIDTYCGCGGNGGAGTSISGAGVTAAAAAEASSAAVAVAAPLTSTTVILMTQ